jgi:hypothetical protein
LAASYGLADNIVGNSFYNAFSFEAIADPTHGRVYVRSIDSLFYLTYLSRNYVDKATALANNYTYASSDAFILRADYKKTLNSSTPGRDSVRLLSNRQYSQHVAMCVVPTVAISLASKQVSASTYATCPRAAGLLSLSIPVIHD